jgi:hypothetical protein
MTSNKTIDIFTKVFSIYALLLTILGTAGNSLSCFICLRKSLRTRATFKLLAFLTVSDIVALYQWNLKHFVATFFGHYDWDLVYLTLCRLDQFLQTSSLQFSAWILVSIALDRLLSILILKWTKFYFRGSRPVVYAFTLLFIILLFNGTTLLTDGYVVIVNGTQKVICDAQPVLDYTIFNIMSQVSF